MVENHETSVPSVKTELKGLILRALEADYIGESCLDKIQTGNHYQSVTLGEMRTTGFRSRRDEFLDRIRFTGKRVLDLGSNLGEISRAARERGAAEVEGFEYDPYFLELANLINAYNDVTRVSFYERDITDPAVYDTHYDIVLCFSVFGYVGKVLKQVAAITDEVFILETHRLTGNLEAEYLNPILRHFPFYALLGESDWGIRQDNDEKRAVIAFAKRASMLTADLDIWMGVQSATRPTGSARSSAAPQGALGRRHLDIRRTKWHEGFFSTFTFGSPDELLAAIQGMQVDLDTIAQSEDSRTLVYYGWVYWFMYVQGYLQYIQGGEIGPGNSHYDYVSRYDLQRARDPGLSKEMASPEQITERITLRFRDFDALRQNRERAFEGPDATPPPQIILGSPILEEGLAIYEVGETLPHFARYVDGHHRIFAAALLGLSTVPCEIIEEDPSPPFLRGIIEHFDFDGHRLRLTGWAMKVGSGMNLFEVRVDGVSVASVGVAYRDDVRQAFADVPHVRHGGFTIDCAYEATNRPFLRFDVVALLDLHPIGMLTVCYLEGMRTERVWPPRALTGRLLGESNPESLAARSVTCLYQMLEPITRHRALRSFGSVLSWGVGYGLLEAFLPHFLPSATTTGVDTDNEAVAWCRQSDLPGTFLHIGASPPMDLAGDAFDLILGYTTMTRLNAVEQRAWLSELHRVVRTGGYIAVTVYGELTRQSVSAPTALEALAAEGLFDATPVKIPGTDDDVPPQRVIYQTRAYAMATYTELFDVVEYIEGGVEGLQD